MAEIAGTYDRLLRDAADRISILNYDTATEALTDVDAANAPTVAITDSAGIAIVGSPFAGVRDAAGTYHVALPTTDLTTLDTYDAVWSWPNGQKRRTVFDVVGEFLFTIPELRAFEPDVANAAKYTPAMIEAARWGVEERFYRIAGVSFVPRGRRVFLDTVASAAIFLPDLEATKVVSAKIGATALTSQDLADLRVYPHGEVFRASGTTWIGTDAGAGARAVEILYEFGYRVPPQAVKRAAMRLAKYELVAFAANANPRASYAVNDLGTFRLTIAGRDGPTGIPDVDAVLKSFGKPKMMGMA